MEETAPSPEIILHNRCDTAIQTVLDLVTGGGITLESSSLIERTPTSLTAAILCHSEGHQFARTIHIEQLSHPGLFVSFTPPLRHEEQISQVQILASEQLRANLFSPFQDDEFTMTVIQTLQTLMHRPPINLDLARILQIVLVEQSSTMFTGGIVWVPSPQRSTTQSARVTISRNGKPHELEVRFSKSISNGSSVPISIVDEMIIQQLLPAFC